MSYDFNDAESKSVDLIPKGTIAPVIMTIRPGKAGDGGWLTQSRNSDYAYLDCEFTVTEGPFKNRKFWSLMMAQHPRPDEEKVAKTLGITRSKLRGVLESARSIDPTDESEAAKAKRIVTGFGDFSGLEFVAKVSVEKGTGGYDDKNGFDTAIPVTSKQHPKNGGTSGASDAPAQQTSNTPAWAS